MARYNVSYNNKWACFSSISDDFVTKFMDKQSYEEWRQKQYGERAIKQTEECNMITMKEAVYSIRINRTYEEAMKCLIQSGLAKTDCEKIMFDMETDYYVPIPKNDGTFECPNCHSQVEHKQIYCDTDDCCLKFVWRN